MALVKCEGWFVPSSLEKDTGPENAGTFEFPEYPIKYIMYKPGKTTYKKKDYEFVATIFFHEEETTYPVAFKVSRFIGRTF